jgi:hypothetical protein
LNAALDIEGDPVEERESWPLEVQVFTDMVGAFLTSLEDGRRMAIIRVMTRELFGERDLLRDHPSPPPLATRAHSA